MKEAERSSADRDREDLDDEVERRQMAANRAGQKSHTKTGGGPGRRAPDQIDPDDVTAGKGNVLLFPKQWKS